MYSLPLSLVFLLFLWKIIYMLSSILFSIVGWVSRTGSTCIFSACPTTPTNILYFISSHCAKKFNQRTRVATLHIELWWLLFLVSFHGCIWQRSNSILLFTLFYWYRKICKTVKPISKGDKSMQNKCYKWILIL